MAPRMASIYFSNLGRKVESGFDHCSNELLNARLPGVFLTAIVLGLGMDRRPQAIAEQADQDCLRDHYVSIKFSEDGL